MATTRQQPPDAETFRIDPTAHLNADVVDGDTPMHVHVEISSTGRTLMAILAAGADGRWSFDFEFDDSEVAIVRAYKEGHQINSGALSAWAEPVCQRISEGLC
ncbi:hypothetical protein [Halorubrum sp. SD683]|uniref:hypothetical protein n=1 Tax=Halorubrum sp. SD683 TaxID=1855873 RepID=UPI000A2D7464|nr:hypothetical protein [Halorubrum sp. SD683]OTF01859.1 hypothetical protein B9G49_01020 [Halorubrum sp. SD683]